MRRTEPVTRIFLGWSPLRRVLFPAAASLTCNLVLAATPAPAAAPSGVPQLDARSQTIHQHFMRLDSHVDVSIQQPGGLDAVALPIAVGPGPRDPEGVTAARARADAKLASIRSFIKVNSAHVALALTSGDVSKIHQQGKIPVIESFLNARSLGRNLNGIDDFYNAGVRLFSFVQVGNNDFADSSRPNGEPAEEFHGLSPLGVQAVAKLNQLGVIIDVSQLTPAGVLQTLQLSKAPVVASHSAVRALVDIAGNLSDRELDAIKANGGVVQVTAFNAYLVAPPPGYREKLRALRTEYALTPDYPAQPLGYTIGTASMPIGARRGFFLATSALYPEASVKDYVDHIDYIVKRIGIDHVGIGTDFNQGAGIQGFQTEALNVKRELLRRGYDEAQIAKIWGGNFLRVFADAEAVARELRATAAR
jgi:membrane dipeptidase